MAPTPTQDSDRHRSPAIADAVKHDRLDELDGLLTGWPARAEQRIRIALQSRVEATRKHVLAGCERSTSFHQGALAVVHDDAVAICAAHRVGEDWHAMLGAPLDWTAVHLAAALGHVASLRALIALGVEIDLETSQGYDRVVPLVLAVRYGQWQAAQVLVEAGSDPNLTYLMKFCRTRRVNCSQRCWHTDCNGPARRSTRRSAAGGAYGSFGEQVGFVSDQPEGRMRRSEGTTPRRWRLSTSSRRATSHAHPLFKAW